MIHITIHWSEADLREVVGFLAAGFVFVTFFSKHMLKLRCFAIVSNVLFITYAYFRDLYPVLILHTLLLPMNLYRLREYFKERQKKDK